MQMIRRSLSILFLLASFLLLDIPKTVAAPPSCNGAAEGTILYNTDHKLVQFCNGAQWIGLTAKIGGAGDTLSDLSCASGEVPEWNGTAWVCGAGGSGASSVWLNDGPGGTSKVYYNGGNVGIGTNDPQQTLHILSTGNTYLNVDSSFNNSTSGILINTVGDGSTGRLIFQKNNVTSGGIAYSHSASANSMALKFDVSGGVEELTVLGNGKVGVGTATPQTRLEVAGSVRIGDGAELCNATAHEGGIRYVAATDAFQMCRNSATGWESIGTSSGGITALTGEVTASGSGSVAATIAANAITNVKMADDAVGIAELSATGTPSATTYLRGDNTWAAVPSGADNLGDHIATTVLRSDTHNTDDLGTTAIRWKDGWFAGTVTGGTFAGSGASLTALNATNLASGTVAAARMPALTGDVTMTAGTTATTLANNAVTSAKIADGTITAADTAIVGTLTEGKWCTVSSGKIVCTVDAPTGSASAGDAQIFTTNGTWTKPSGVTSTSRSFVQIWGGGGSGASFTTNGSGGGGGGGGYYEAWILTSNLGATVPALVGSGGASVTNNAGNAGASSQFHFFTAFGGAGGAVAASGNGGGGGGGGGALGSGSSSYGTGGGAGGNPSGSIVGGGTGGNGAFSGTPGSPGQNTIWGGGGGGGGQAASAMGGRGGNSFNGGGGGGGGSNTGSGGVGGVSGIGGNGGVGGSNGGAPGAGIAPGGGGGGSDKDVPSGAGANGRVIVTTYF